MSLSSEITAENSGSGWLSGLALLKGRKFQLWEFRVGHGSLLVRSPKDNEHSTNIDVICTGVEYLELPRFMADLSIDQANPDEISKAKIVLMGRFREADRTRIFAVSGNRFVVVSSSLNITETEGGWWESPFEFPRAAPHIE